MIIYQIHERSGDFESYYDIIKGSFFNREDAEKKVEMLRNAICPCNTCPAYFCLPGCGGDCDENCPANDIENIRKHCSYYEPVDGNSNEVSNCRNFSLSLVERQYVIKEVEVV